MDDLVSTRRLCDLAGVTYRQADYWCRIGYLRPVVEAAGSGSRRGFDEREVAVAAALGRFMRSTRGAAPGTVIWRTAETLRALDADRWDGPLLLDEAGEDARRDLHRAAYVLQLPPLREPALA